MTSQEIMALERLYGAKNYAPVEVVFSRALGAEVWDPEGRRYLDFVSGIAAVSQGHCHPELVKVVAEQAGRLTLPSRAFFSDTFGPFAEAATRYFGFDRILVMNTGVEAFEAALKLSRKWGYVRKGIAENQAKIIVCENNFHGRTLAAISASTSPKGRGHFGPFLEGFVKIPFGDAAALEAALGDGDVAAFFVEPIQGEGGVNVPPEGFLRRARELCTATRTLLVADEVQTGIGRTGKRLACDHEGVKPDILMLGKALSGGMLPVSAVLADDGVLGVFEPGDHGSTFGGNALACAVAKAALEIVHKEGLVDNAEKRGARLREGIRKLESPWIREVRGRGLLVGIELEPARAPKAAEIAALLKDKGLLVKETRDTVLRLAPPLMIPEVLVDEGLSRLAQIF